MYWEEWQSYADNEENWRENTERGLFKAEVVEGYLLRLWFEEEMEYLLNIRGQRSSTFGKSRTSGLTRPVLLRRYEMDVSIYELDFYPLFVIENPGGVFSVLADPERFRLVVGDYALAWLNPETGVYDETTIDIAPECIRFFCERYGKKLKGVDSHPTQELAMA